MVSRFDILNARILLVDDNEENLKSLEQILRLAGYASITLTSKPREVCELHRRNRYALILLDLQMPQLDGFGVMAALKQIEMEAGSYLSVLAITGNSQHKLRALQSGARDFISKLFDPPELLTRVYNLLEVRLLYEETRHQGKLLESLALYDPLTGVANRRLLLDRMSMAIAHARRSKMGMAVMYIDLDGFKQINDSLGHATGDLLLKSVALRLIAAIRAEDTVARWGGDEFVILLPHIQATIDSARMAEKIIDAVAQPYAIGGHTVRVTISVGIGIHPDHGVEPNTLLKAADDAMYAAKRAGKNAYRISGE